MARRWRSCRDGRRVIDCVRDRLDFLSFPTTTAAVASLFSDNAGRAAKEDGSARRWLRRRSGQQHDPRRWLRQRYGQRQVVAHWFDQ
ncbi:hypothetical protein MRB53_033300 [Persea americana]|uniref:Uncharacterized protein n=1 Tax=Persea americana TaxID=3435 RepID=A0ACC2KUV1_PERAE|nr:hypothetical protein MRB53_033300 [Persea americana]